MSAKKIKTEYIIIALIIVLGAYLLLKRSDNMNYQVPDLPSIKSADINRIEITRVGAVIRLVQKENKWIIEPQNYPVDKTKIEKITGTIANLTLSTLVAESGNYALYGLDKENKIEVKAFNQDKLLRHFELGKAASTYHHTFVRFPETKNVYYAMENFRYDFEQKTDDLRDKLVLKFDKNEVSEIKVSSPDGELTLVKNIKPAPAPAINKDNKVVPTAPGKQEATWTTKDGKEADNEKIDALINQMADLSCDQYVENKSKGDMANPIYSVWIKGNKEYSLSIYAKTDDKEAKYPALSSENAYVFFLPGFKADNIMKKPADLVKGEKAPEKGKK